MPVIIPILEGTSSPQPCILVEEDNIHFPLCIRLFFYLKKYLKPLAKTSPNVLSLFHLFLFKGNFIKIILKISFYMFGFLNAG